MAERPMFPLAHERLAAARRVKQRRAARLLTFSASSLADALYYLGGGSCSLEDRDRLCFCRGSKNHSTACDKAWESWRDAGCPDPVDSTERERAECARVREWRKS